MKEFIIDFRVRKLESREVRDGGAIHFERRTNIINLDGSIKEGEWVRAGSILNYGECFDKKPSFLERLFGV